MAQLYRTCDIGLVFMFSRHPSYQPLEYMASGCVTVTNVNEANSWLFRDGRNCILAPPTVSGCVDAMRRLIDDNQLRQRIVRGGLSTVARLNWRNVEQKVCRFIMEGKK
ncbi:MAG: glycosyltransferase family 4 protein [Deltaproteobacteria bacterium]|nr:glycosyltransferase family 4 protein [Deltaproteobacteria bacterium]